MSCRACGGATDPVFEMEPMPLAAAFAATIEEALDAPRYPLTWAQCRRCGLVNVEPDIPDEVLFRHYRYSSSDVPGLVRHHGEFANFLVGRYGPKIPVRVLEIGCNDGVLLNQLPREWDRVGVDPSDVAREKQGDYPLIPLPFDGNIARALGRFHLVVSSNAFAHFSGIAEALDGVAACLRYGGEFWVEVHDLAATLALGQWDTVYHEHKVEWSETALRNAAALHGFECIGIQHLPLHGGLLRLGFRKTASPPGLVHESVDFASLRDAYAARRAPALPAGSVAYGAAARASVYLNQVDVPLRYIVDGSPRRAGRFLPGIGLPIVAPDVFDAAPPPAALITAWNHASDIRARHPRYEGWVSAW